MSVRANSLQCVLIDSVYLSVLIAAAAATTSLVAKGAEPRTTQLAKDPKMIESLDNARPSSDHIDSRQNTDDVLATGDPNESPEAKREAMMLGMTLLERSESDIRVEDVAATSPAWDAGIRPGDQIRSLDGVKPKRLSSWIDDVQRILDDTPDGHAISAIIERDGEKIDLRIDVPVSNAEQARGVRKADEELARARMRDMKERQMAQGAPGGMPVGRALEDRYMNDDRIYGGYGGYGLGGFFVDDAPPTRDDADDRLVNSAVAPLHAVSTVGGRAAGNQSSLGGQVGIAGFQNNGGGVDAVVMVNGLPQGVYRAGIGERIGADATTGLDPLNPAGLNDEGLNPALEGSGAGNNRTNNNRNDQFRDPSDSSTRNPYDPRQNQPVNQQQNQGFSPPANQTPNTPPGVTPGTGNNPATGGGPGAGGATESGAEGASLANPSNAILAQQFDPQLQSRDNSGGQLNQTPTNNTRQQGTTPQRGARNPYDPRQIAENQRQQQGGLPQSNLGGSNFIAKIGTLQVGPDGVGRVQGRFDGMSVRDLVGMNVIVEATNFQGTGSRGTGGSQIDPRTTRGEAARTTQAVGPQNPTGQPQHQNQPLAGQNRQVPGQSPGRNEQQTLPANGASTGTPHGIVAMGTIQLRRGGDMTGATSQPSPQTGLQPQQQPRNRAGGATPAGAPATAPPSGTSPIGVRGAAR